MPTISDAAEEFAEAHLGKPRFPRSSKVIHDAIWGTHLLHPHEVATLDTALLQRLRYLHQTGLSFLTYPSTTHTRFEHTLGVLYQADRLVRALADKYDSEKEHPFPKSLQIKIRMAALLHDCSHGIFSHTSEEIYRLYPEMQALIGRGGRFEGMSPSEVLASLILDSKSFRRFFSELEKETIVLDFAPEELANLILGKKPDKLQGFQTDIINGPFDADKLDYISRDGHYSGLPLGIDLDRLSYATEIHLLKKDELAGEISLDSDHRRLVMSRSGVNSLEQIVASRMNLTASLYHHHKVRAAECMVKSAVEYARKRGLSIAGRNFETPFDFLWLTDSTFLSDFDRNPDKGLRRLIGNIAHRHLLVRSLVIAGISFAGPASDVRDDGTEGDGAKLNMVYKLAALKKTPDGAERLRTLAGRICEEAGKPCLQEEIWIDLPEVPKTKDLERTFVNIGTRKEPDFKTLSKFIPLDQWGKQYIINKWRGHVFCPPECVEKVGAAAQEVLGEEFQIEFNRYAFALANLSPPA